ncbi:MAG: purine-nucleoside phosphorylase [Bacteroidales bacterium]|nr:purine-nucleoside phosphorylase [Bacteroidales bacterium]
MWEKLQETVNYILGIIDQKPSVGLVLGTGLGNLADEIKVDFDIPYQNIPNFPVSTVKGHQGKLIFGTLGGKYVVAMKGRFHFYEGYSMNQITFPIRVLKFLGIETLILSNAAGGMNPEFQVGDIMIINDHVNLMGTNPLIGLNDERLGPRFPDMSEVYDKALIQSIRKIARHHNIVIQSGVYAAVTGPTYETPAEYNYIRSIGADAVGMSTIPEAIVARHMGIPCFAVSIITDLGVNGKIVEITHEEVIEAAVAAEPRVKILVTELIEKL